MSGDARLVIRPVFGFMSEPGGGVSISIFAFVEQLIVDVNGCRVLEMALHRPDSLAVLDEVLVTMLVREGSAKSTRMTVEQAKAFAKGCEVGTPAGRVGIGAYVISALEQHAALWRAARGQG